MGKHAKPEPPSTTTHDSLCPNSTGSCCPWITTRVCDCQCMCDLIREIRCDERDKMIFGYSTLSQTITGVGPLTYTFSSTDELENPIPPCDNCGERCWEPLPMSKRAQRIYNALFRGPNAPIKWDETDDCGSRNLMRLVAVEAAYASKKGTYQ